MAAYSKAQRDYHKSRIRAIMVHNPDASDRYIKETLQAAKQAPLSLHRTYIATIKKKILVERTNRHNGANIAHRLAFIQDKIRQIDKQLWDLVNSEHIGDREKIAALKELRENEIKLLQAEMDAGLYDRKLGTIDIEALRNRQIDPAHQQRAIDSFKAWGFIEADAVEVETKQPNDQPQPIAEALPGGSANSPQ